MNWENIQKTKINLGTVVLIGLLSTGFADSKTSWKRIWPGISESKTKKVYLDAQTINSFWLLTEHSLYHIDGSKSPHLIAHKTVNSVYQDPEDVQTTYFAASEGLFVYGSDKNVRMIFGKHGCLSVISSGARLFAGTQEGLFVRDGADESWKSVSGKLSKEPVRHLASFGNVIYVATPTALYRYDTATDEYKQIFSSGISKEAVIEPDTSEDEGSYVAPDIYDLDIAGDSSIYVVTRKGIYYSRDDGENWQIVSSEGLPRTSLNSLSLSTQEPRLLVASAEGVFSLINNRWEESYKGMNTNSVYDITQDNEGNIYAATDRGFFILPKEKAFAASDDVVSTVSIFKNYSEVERYFENEPTIKEVQDMAVRYADVHPDKIVRWQRQSRIKALLPSVSAGIDRSATDLMHWDTGSSPDVLSKGRDFLEWDLGVAWDLGDLVWSSNQTSIDSRSKLMVELREEVMDQVTRLYFERRRVQIGLLSDKDDSYSNIEEQMRLAELTAIIDGFTGGRFSEMIRERA